MIQKKNIIKHYFCILRDIFSLKDFLTRPPSTNFLVVFWFRKSLSATQYTDMEIRSHTAVRQMATRKVGNVLLLRNKIKLTLTAAAGFVGGPVFSSLCESGANVGSLVSRKTLPEPKQPRSWYSVVSLKNLSNWIYPLICKNNFCIIFFLNHKYIPLFNYALYFETLKIAIPHL